jgi:hypothetical protein
MGDAARACVMVAHSLGSSEANYLVQAFDHEL